MPPRVRRLTGGLAESSCGGYFPPALRLAGYDGLVISGRAENPSYLLIDKGSVTIEDAGSLWGKGILECTADLQKAYGKKSTSLVIGPAGENLVPFACILNESHHAFGRCGMGAVMGSKNLKALVVKSGTGDLSVADPERIKSLIKELTPRIKDYLISQVLHDFGTSGNLEGHMYEGDVPVRNWTSNFDEEMAGALTGSTLSEKYPEKNRHLRLLRGRLQEDRADRRRAIRHRPKGRGRNTKPLWPSAASRAHRTWPPSARREGSAMTSAWTRSAPAPRLPGPWKPMRKATSRMNRPMVSRSPGAIWIRW